MIGAFVFPGLTIGEFSQLGNTGLQTLQDNEDVSLPAAASAHEFSIGPYSVAGKSHVVSNPTAIVHGVLGWDGADFVYTHRWRNDGSQIANALKPAFTGNFIDYQNSAGVSKVRADYQGNFTISGDLTASKVFLGSDATANLQAVTYQQLVAAVAGVYRIQGGYNPTVTSAYPVAANTTNPVSATIQQGMLWIVTVDGTIGSDPVKQGDEVVALVNNPGNDPTKWNITSHDIGYMPLSNVLNSGRIFVGSASNIATGVAASGAVSVTNAGVFSINLSAGATITGITPPANGGTGIANTGTFTIGGNTSFSGAFTFNGILTDNTSVTFPTSGILATVGGSVPSIQGTSNRVTVNGGSGVPISGVAVTLSLPQDIDSFASVNFGSLNLTRVTGTQAQIISTGTTTASSQTFYTNTTAGFLVGVNNSAGTVITGGLPYSGLTGTTLGHSLQLFTNTVARVTILSTGEFIVNATAAIGGSSAKHQVSGDALVSGVFIGLGNGAIGTSDIEAWNTGYRVIQAGSASAILSGAGSDPNYTALLSNAYLDASNWKYRTTNLAASYDMFNGVHRFRYAVSGTIDTVISWEDTLVINAGTSVLQRSNGNLSHAIKRGSNFVALIGSSSGSNALSGIMDLYHDSQSVPNIRMQASGDSWIGVGATAGKFLIGTNAALSGSPAKAQLLGDFFMQGDFGMTGSFQTSGQVVGLGGFIGPGNEGGETVVINLTTASSITVTGGIVTGHA